MPGRSTEAKCLVWDLDNTLWSGVLLEGDPVRLRPSARQTVRKLDERGILQSIASRNDRDAAMRQLAEYQLDEFFLYPQIDWGLKSVSVATIAERLGLATSEIAFIDDDPFERDEVAASLPDVLCIDAATLPSLLDMRELSPRFITEDSRRRRSMYRAEEERRRTAAVMPPAAFVRSLGMVFTISRAAEHDLRRLEELTVRTHQLNSTGYTYSYDELNEFRKSRHHSLLIAGLDDAYGTYGKVGMALVECRDDFWLLKLLLMSCRVMSRGVGKILLSHVLQTARVERARVRAEFLRTQRNRMMYLTFKLAGFSEIDRAGNVALLEHDLSVIDPFPAHVEVRVLS